MLRPIVELDRGYRDGGGDVRSDCQRAGVRQLHRGGRPGGTLVIAIHYELEKHCTACLRSHPTNDLSSRPKWTNRRKPPTRLQNHDVILTLSLRRPRTCGFSNAPVEAPAYLIEETQTAPVFSSEGKTAVPQRPRWADTADARRTTDTSPPPAGRGQSRKGPEYFRGNPCSEPGNRAALTGNETYSQYSEEKAKTGDTEQPGQKMTVLSHDTNFFIRPALRKGMVGSEGFEPPTSCL